MKLLEKLAWIDRLPRPEKNGMKGVLLMLSFFWFALSPITAGDQAGPVDAIICEVMPWKCLNSPDRELSAKRGRLWRFVSNVHFGPKSQSVRQTCSCHQDLKTGNTIQHLTGDLSPTCDSLRFTQDDYGIDMTEWHATGLHCSGNDPCLLISWGLYIDGRIISGEYERFHCTEDSNYSSPGIIVTPE